MNRIEELVEKAIAMLKGMGHAPSSIEVAYARSFKPILKRFDEIGLDVYSKSAIDELSAIYLNECERRALSRDTYRQRMRGIRILEEIAATGGFEWKVFKQKQPDGLLQQYSDLLAGFLQELEVSGQRDTKGYSSIAKRFFLFLQSDGIESLEKLSPETVQAFMVDISAARPKSMKAVVTLLRKLDRFFQRKRVTGQSFEGAVAVARTRYKKVRPGLPKDDFKTIVGAIDTTAAIGKRDYAMLLLAASTGLRACDVARLKLADIDWLRCEINIVQSKTGVPIALPLNKTAGSAIAEYILNGRPKSSASNVFLRGVAPFAALRDGASIGCVMRRRLRDAGVNRTPGDGKTFHGVRRMLGTNLVVSGVPLATVSQILGHAGSQAVRQYVSLNIAELKECALAFGSLKAGAANV
jgi:integrase